MLYVKEGTITIDFDAICDVEKCDNKATVFSSDSKLCQKHNEAYMEANGIRRVSAEEALARI